MLLAQACHTVDVIDQLETAIANDGVIAEGSRGQKVTHPAVDEIRLQRVTLARLLAALALPDSEGGRTVATGYQGRSAAGHRQRWANVREMKRSGA
ncbi:MAG TPA: hypothetical protein VK923_02945 [Euzebyales bacterium]|nr:hypothetical protein [Euzebyales bacterium]